MPVRITAGSSIGIAATTAALVLLLPLQTLACQPVPAKTWRGAVDYVVPQSGAGYNAFKINDCAWPHPSMDGVDATAVNVASHRGLPISSRWTAGGPMVPDAVVFEFCGTATLHRWVQTDGGTSMTASVPLDATWLLVAPGSDRELATDVSVTLTSPGRKCAP